MKGRGILGALNKKSIRSLLEGIDEYEVSQKRIKGGNLNSIKSLYDEFLKTDSKPQRDRLINEFKKMAEGKSSNEMLPLLLAVSKKSKSLGLKFSNEEMKIIIDSLMSEATPAQRQQINMMLNIMNQ